MSKFSQELLVSHEGFELYYNRVDDDLKSVTEMVSFFRKLSSVESSYAKEILKISKASDPKLWKKTDKEIGTLSQCWSSFHSELEKVSKAHDGLATLIGKELVTEIEAWLKEREKQSKIVLKNGQKLTRDMNDTISSLKRAKENYYKLHKASDQANIAYTSKKSDPAIKPKEVDKLKKKATEAKEKADAADSNYKKVLEKANAHQTKFYTQEMPGLLDEFQKFEEEKTQFFKKLMQDYMNSFSQFPGVLSTTCETLTKVVAAIDEAADIGTFISENKSSAVTPPPATEYEPYDSEYKGSIVDLGTKGSHEDGEPAIDKKPPAVSKPDRTAKTADTKKNWGLQPEDSSLSVEEKRRKLEGQLSEIKEVIASEVKSKKGLDKLVKFYASDPVAQKKATQEASDQQAKVDALKEEKKKITEQLNGLGGESAVSTDDKGGDQSSEEEAVEVKAKALFDYEAANDTELGFKAGDILTVTEQDSSGWWYAELNGKQGFVPCNYMEVK